jgi:membrane associated rhomboid family serine protease
VQQQPNFLQNAWRMAPAVSITIAINLVVFVMWQFAKNSQGMWQFMTDNFLVSGEFVMHGRFWTLVTNAYSHIEFWHILVNMFVLWSFGTVLERLWGWRTFVGFYLACSVVGALGHWLASAWLMGDGAQLALGASGAVCGLLTAFGLHYPKSRILIMGIVPVPALIAVAALAGFDVLGLIQQTRVRAGNIGHAAHLGGGLCGLLIWFAFIRQRFASPVR